MAIVRNKDGMGIIANGFYGEVDPSFCTPSAYGAGVPSTASAFASEVRADSATGAMYMSLTKGDVKWVDYH